MARTTQLGSLLRESTQPRRQFFKPALWLAILGGWYTIVAPAVATSNPEPLCLTPADCKWRGDEHRARREYPEAVRFYREGCSRGPARIFSARRAAAACCDSLAWMMQKGWGVTGDGLEVAYLMGRSMDLYGAGNSSTLRNFLAKEPSVRSQLHAGCAQDQGRDCHVLALLQFEDWMQRQESQPEDPLWEKACRLGHCGSLGRFGGSAPVIVEFSRQACEAGILSGCRAFGDAALEMDPRSERPPIDEILRSYGRACEGGDLRSCGALGGLRVGGATAEVEVEEARRLLHRACRSGFAKSCRLLAVSTWEKGSLEGKWSTPVTIQAMAQQVQWACSSDEELYDCIAAAQFYELGREDEQDDGEVARLYRRACYAGSVRHCANFGVQRFESPPSSPPQRALSQERKECYESGGDWPCPRLLRRLAGSVEVVHAGRTATEIVHGLEAACQLGNAQACAYVGFAFWQGHGVSQSDTEAVAYLRRACEGQDAYGCRFLAFLAETGQGMTQDQAEAAQLYQRVCRFNRSNAFGCSTPWGRDLSDQGWQHHAALALRLEPENRPSVNELAQRLGESCKGGDGFGCRYLAARYGPRNGSLGTVRDQARLYRQSCDLGNLVGCLSLGHLLMGRGERSVIKDRNEAARLFEKACEGGIESACQALDPDGFLHFSGWIERSWVSVADFLTRLGS